MTHPPSLHTVIVGLLRRGWPLAGATIVTCSVFAAHALDAVAAARDVGDEAHAPLPTPNAATAKPASTARTRPSDSAFVMRDMFCSDCTAMTRGPDGDIPLSGAPAVLIATSLGDDRSATVRVIPSDVQGAWSMGERIPGVGTVDRIGPTYLIVLDEVTGRRARLSLFDPAAAGSSAGAATPGAGSAAATPDDPFADRVHKINDHTYEVDRNLVRELVSGAAKPGAVRIVPVMEKGEVAGVRFLGVKAGSLPTAIGLRNGDVMSTIDGAPIKTAQQLLDLIAKLDTVSGVQLGGTRAGAPLAIDLRLR